ncbi:MAG: hypothetical protein GY756_03930 [bacterium]|nr:hypothetical protein [bacterium]
MKIKEYLILIFALTLTCCEPYQYIYLRNYSNKPLTIDVYYQINKHWPSRYNYLPKLIYCDSIFKNIRMLSFQKFKDTLFCDYFDKNHYKFTLNSKTTAILCPIGSKFPIKRTIVHFDNMPDTLIFGDGYNFRKSDKDKCKVKKYLLHYGYYKVNLYD